MYRRAATKQTHQSLHATDRIVLWPLLATVLPVPSAFLDLCWLLVSHVPFYVRVVYKVLCTRNEVAFDNNLVSIWFDTSLFFSFCPFSTKGKFLHSNHFIFYISLTSLLLNSISISVFFPLTLGPYYKTLNQFT